MSAAIILLLAAGALDLANVQPTKYWELAKPDHHVADREGILGSERLLVESLIADFKINAYIAVVGKMFAEQGWVDEEESGEIGSDLIVKFSTSLAHRWNCTDDCALFVLAVADRKLKLRCQTMPDRTIDVIIDGIKPHLRERNYVPAIMDVLKKVHDVSNQSNSWSGVLLFLMTLAIFSVSAPILSKKKPLLWVGLLISHLIFRHWLVLLATIVVTAMEFVRLFKAPSPPPRSDLDWVV